MVALATALERLGSALLAGGSRRERVPLELDPRGLLDPARGLTIYVHLPFCSSLCSYCTFDRVRDLSSLERYLRALEAELALHARGELAGATVSSLFLGGGTPSLLPAEAIERVLAAIRGAFRLAPGAQLTLEANPESVVAAKLARYRAAGVNRISLGVQTFDELQLRRLGRRHGRAQIARALELLAAAGFALVSLDLMYGLPGEDAAGLARDLEHALAAGVAHLSIFPVIHRPGSALARSAHPPSLLTLHASYREASRRLAAAGFVPYTPEDFARRPEARCAYQLDAWRPAARGCLGLGSGALSGSALGSWRNHRLERYMALALGGELPIAALSRFNRREQMRAYLLRSAKTLELDRAAFARTFGQSFSHAYPGLGAALRLARLARPAGEELGLTVEGRFVASLFWTGWILETLGEI